MIQLISIHIPKTGGRSFDAALKQIYGTGNVFNVSREVLKRKNAPLERVVPPGARILHCHLWFSDLAPLLKDGNIPIVAWLRDPVERVISHYYFFQERARSGARPDYLHRISETLEEYIRRPEARNLMSRFLKNISLDNLFFTGVLEHFSEDLRDLGRLLQWGRVKPSVLNSNRSFRDQFGPVPAELQEEIRRLNGEDAALYQEALRLRARRRQTRPLRFKCMDGLRELCALGGTRTP